MNGTVAIVGGASSGMGLAIARALAAEGTAVTMLARDPDRLAAAAGSVPGAMTVAGDVRDRDVLVRAVEQTTAQRGRLDIVIDNAGGPSPGTFDTTPEDAWLDAFELSLHATIRLTKLALPHLRAQRPRPSREHHLVVGARADSQPDPVQHDPPRRNRAGPRPSRTSLAPRGSR